MGKKRQKIAIYKKLIFCFRIRFSWYKFWSDYVSRGLPFKAYNSCNKLKSSTREKHRPGLKNRHITRSQILTKSQRLNSPCTRRKRPILILNRRTEFRSLRIWKKRSQRFKVFGKPIRLSCLKCTNFLWDMHMFSQIQLRLRDFSLITRKFSAKNAIVSQLRLSNTCHFCTLTLQSLNKLSWFPRFFPRLWDLIRDKTAAIFDKNFRDFLPGLIIRRDNHGSVYFLTLVFYML